MSIALFLGVLFIGAAKGAELAKWPPLIVGAWLGAGVLNLGLAILEALA